jgi:8-oxo-dGTP diphosphatase
MIQEMYGGRIRLRVCGILWNEEKILLLNHSGIGKDGIFWNCPGGGVEEGESIVQALTREFKEETKLEIQVQELYHWDEVIYGKLHGVELYFNVSASNFAAQLGKDPEGNILTELRWFTKEEIHQLPKGHCPPFLRGLC